MAEQDEWKLGDESAAGQGACPACGEWNRAGLARCEGCGARLAGGRDDEPAPLRTLGEAMGRRRAPRRRVQAPTWLWSAAVVAVLAIAAARYWSSAYPERHLTLDAEALAPARGAAPSPAAPPETLREGPQGRNAGAPVSAVLEGGSASARRSTVDGAHERVEASSRVAPPPPVAPSPRATAAPRAEAAVEQRAPIVAPPRSMPPPVPRKAPAERPERASTAPPAPAAPPAPPASRGGAAAPTLSTPAERPIAPGRPAERSVAVPPAPPHDLQDRPSLGSDLAEARRAYAAAIQAYNARADDYNALADEYQRREGAGDPALSALADRLERARVAADTARAQADVLRQRMEEVQARYR